jgi:hypothetical protein
LHWAAGELLAFDAEKGQWSSDYSAPDKLPPVPMGHGHGRVGVTYCGSGVLLESRVPAPSYTIQAGCYDSKRRRIVFPMRGLMAFYDPATRKWGEQPATTVIAGGEYPGSPPVFGIGACYDPHNDEILIQPHYVGTAGPGVPFMSLPKNLDRRDVDGRVSSHLGTLRFSYADNAWRRVSDTFGSDDIKAARKALFDQVEVLSDALDDVWVIRRRPKAKDPGKITAALGAVASALVKSEGPLTLVKQDLAEGAAHVAVVADVAQRNEWDAALAAGRDALWAIEAVFDGPLRVEPPPRCAASMVYDAKSEVIVLFGGYGGLVPPGGSCRPGELNDTWLYDVKSKQWRQVAVDKRPPPQLISHLFYDSVCGVVILVAFEAGNNRDKSPDRVSIWTFDAAAGEWSKRHEAEWRDGLPTRNTYAARIPRWSVGYDLEYRLLLVTLPDGTNIAMRLALETLPVEAAPAWEPTPAGPQILPPDDPEFVASLKELPANQWQPLEPKGAVAHRGWSNIACDQVRGHIYYYGGGHSTYQVNDVAVYAVGANSWFDAAGDHNDFVPAAGWGGCTMGFRGGQWAHHMRNQYVAIDGRMYVAAQQTDRIADMNGEPARDGQLPHISWFYDVDRGGVWRQHVLPEKNVTVEVDVERLMDVVHMTDPTAGLVLGMHGGQNHWEKSHLRVRDIYAETLRWVRTGGEIPAPGMEGRAFDMVRGRNQIFYLASSFSERDEKAGSCQPWLYEIDGNRWIKLKSEGTPPPARPLIVCCLDGQDAVWVCLARQWGRERSEWFYSLDTGQWRQIKGTTPDVAYPYGQVVFVQKFGVLINVAQRPARVMRPDVNKSN